MNIGFTGPLLKVITESMVKKQKDKSTQIFHFYSGHDNTLIYIMNALKIFNNIWPPYRSCLVFELREKRNAKFVTVTTLQLFYAHHKANEK